MSDIDKDELKREYLPLVNTNSEGRELVNPNVNHKSMISDDRTENKYSVVKQANVVADAEEQTFFQKNKKIIFIALGVLLAAGLITGIVLLIVGKGGDNPPVPPTPPVPPPEPIEPDPYHYQEFNPYYITPGGS